MHSHRKTIDDQLTYEVIVGHTRIRVTGRDQTDAVEKARHRLCVDNPRLWDIIQSLELRCFQIHRIPPLP